MNNGFNYYKTTLAVMTAARARAIGLRPLRHYGYYVTITPKPPASTSPHPTIGISAWCRTKAVAIRHVQEDNDAKTKGYHACPHECDMQARRCPHGIPADLTLSPV